MIAAIWPDRIPCNAKRTLQNITQELADLGFPIRSHRQFGYAYAPLYHEVAA